jgi:hypothetical protein
MTTVTINDTDKPLPASPSAQAVAKGAVVHMVPDGSGRKIFLRKPDVLSQYRLIEVLGTSAANTTYVSMVLPLIYVVKVGDEDVTLPAHKSEVDALIKMLGDEGVEAVMVGVAKHWGKQDPQGDKDALKK